MSFLLLLINIAIYRCNWYNISIHHIWESSRNGIFRHLLRIYTLLTSFLYFKFSILNLNYVRSCRRCLENHKIYWQYGMDFIFFSLVFKHLPKTWDLVFNIFTTQFCLGIGSSFPSYDLGKQTYFLLLLLKSHISKFLIGVYTILF